VASFSEGHLITLEYFKILEPADDRAIRATNGGILEAMLNTEICREANSFLWQILSEDF